MAERLTDANGHRVTFRELLKHQRELLEQKICALDKRIDERFNARDENLILQAEEYERRLETLTSEREADEAHRKDLNQWRETKTIAVASIIAVIVSAFITAFFN